MSPKREPPSDGSQPLVSEPHGAASVVPANPPAVAPSTGAIPAEVTSAVTRGVADGVVRALQDPEIRDQARHGADAAWTAVQDAASGIARMMVMQRGRTGLSSACSLGGVALIVVSILDVINITNFKSPFEYFLNMYLFAIGWIILFLEADLDRLKTIVLIGRLEPCVRRCHDWIDREMHFLTYLKTRGFFYLFVGLLCAMQCFICITFPIGIWNIFVGLTCITLPPGEPLIEARARPLVDARAEPLV